MYASPQKTSNPTTEKLKCNATPNSNPEQVPAYMNSMKIVPSPAFNFDGPSNTDLANNTALQPHQNQSPKTIESSDNITHQIPKITNNIPSKDEQKPELTTFQRNKSNSVPAPNDQVKTEPDMLSEKDRENSTEANSNHTPDRFEVLPSRNRGSSTKVNTEPAPISSSNKEKTVNKHGLLDSDCSGIPLNIQMLKQKFKTQESKAVKQEEDFKNIRPAGQPSSVQKNQMTLKHEETKKEKDISDSSKMDQPSQNVTKQAEGQSTNYIYKKFTEAALVKKEEPAKKSSPNKRTIETIEDAKRHPEQTIKANSVKNYQGSVEMLQSLTSPSKPQSPGMQTEQPKRAARIPQDNLMQGHVRSQYAQMQGSRHGVHSPLLMNEVTSLNVSQSEIIPPSRDPVNVSGLLDNSHLMRMTNWAGNPHVDFSMQNWQATNPLEFQKKTLSIINFYEQHLNNFKGLIIQQTNVIEAQKVKITNLENHAKESTDKVKVFEEELYKQTMNHQRAYQELLQKYSETATQLSRSQSELEKALKRLGELSLHETGPPAQEIIMSPPRNQDKGQDNLNDLYQEIFSIKKDLNTQREIMKEIRQSTPVKYEHESNKKEGANRSVYSSKHEDVRNETDTVYPLVNSSERVNESGLKRSFGSSSVPRLNQRRDRSFDNQYEEGENRGRANKSTFRSRSPIPDNVPHVNISKQNSQGTRVKDLLNWHTPSKTRDQTSPNKSSRAVQVEPNSRLTTDNETDIHNLTCEERAVIDNNRSSSTDTYKQSRPYIFGLSSNQKSRENSEEIEKLQQLMRDLYHERKAVEDELLKIPENWKNLEQRRRKTKIEGELERLDEKMEEYKSRMRELTGSPIKQRR